MKAFMISIKTALLVAMITFPAIMAHAEPNTEITGFYQRYQDFSYRTGISQLDIAPVALEGGGFSLAQNFAPWFAMWTQFSFYGSAGQPNMSVRIINNQQGIRYQTRQYGPLRLYARSGLGFSRYSLNITGNDAGDTKFSFAYGGGAQIWVSEYFGFVLDASHVVMGVPNLTDLPGREKWDSGMTYTTGITVRF
jgi:hypothetical protein